VSLARDTSGKRVIAHNRAKDIAGIAIFPRSNTLSVDNAPVSRIFANALIYAAGGGFGITTPTYVDRSPFTINGIARNRIITRVTVQTSGAPAPAVLETTTRTFSLSGVALTPGSNRIIAHGFAGETTLAAIDTFEVFLDQTIPGPVVGPLVIGVTDSTATLALETDEPTMVKIAFGASPTSIDTVKTTDSPEFQRSHQLVIRGLLPDAPYYVKVRLSDRAGNKTAYLPNPPVSLHTRRGNDTVAPWVVRYPAAAGLSRTSAVVRASNEEISRGFVQIVAGDSTQPFTEIPGPNNQFVFQHRIQVTGLVPGTIYFYRMRFSDASDNSTLTSFQSFTTPLTDDTTPPRFTNGPAVLLATARRTVIVYETDEVSDTEVLVNEIGSSDVIAIKEDDPVLDHRVVVANLEAGKNYEYRVRSTDQLGNTEESSRRTFKTSEPDKLIPVITEGPVVGYNGGNLIAIEVTTDEPATSRLDVAPVDDPTDITTTFGGINVTNHHLTLTNLSLGKSYRYVVTITDPSGNSVTFPPNGLTSKEIGELSESRILFKTLQSPGLTGRFTTNQGSDTQAPIVLAGPTIIGRTSNTLTVSWQTDELSSSAIDYGSSGLAQNTNSGEMVTNHVLTLTNLAPGTTYNYRISSRELLGNGPTQGPLPALIAAGSTAGQPDISSPVISVVAVAAITDDRAIITWNTNEPASSFVDFDLTSSNLAQNLGKTTLTTSHTVTLTNLGPGPTYFYRVRSTDGNGNAPAVDVVRSFTTTGNKDTAAPVIGNLSIRPGYRTIRVSWKTDEPASSFVDIINGIGDTLVVASRHLVKDHTVVVTDSSFFPKGAVQYTVIAGSLDPSRNSTSTPPQTVLTLASSDVTPPAAPATPTAAPGNNSITVSWAPNTETDFGSYNLYRVSGADTVLIQSGSAVPTYRDEAVVNGTEYTYFLTATDAAIPVPNTGARSATVTITPSGALAPSVPVLIAPVANAEVSVRPLLVVSNATSGSGTRTYDFALYADSTLNQLVVAVSGIPEGSATNPTHWQVIDPSLADSLVLQDGVRYWWRARATSGTIEGEWSTPSSFVASSSNPTAVLNPTQPTASLPNVYSLEQNYPNPFNPSTRIRYALPRRGNVTLTIYNILGQKVIRLLNHQPQDAGNFVIDWNGCNTDGNPAGSGLYLYRIEVRDADGNESYADVKKITLIK